MNENNKELTAKQRYRKKVFRFTVDFYPTEKELVDKINEQTKKQTYIKNLIRKDIKSQRKEQI